MKSIAVKALVDAAFTQAFHAIMDVFASLM